MPSLELTAAPLELPLVHTFTIARSSESVARTVLVRLRWGAIEALGESSPSERYDESVASVDRRLAARARWATIPTRSTRCSTDLPPAQRCGLDVALHDCIGKDVDRPLWRLLGLDPSRTPLTSFTIGIAPIDEMLAKVREVGEHPVLKIKLGAGNEIETIAAIRAIYTRHDPHRRQRRPGRPNRRSTILRELERFEIEFCEQPIPAGTPERLRWIRERTSIPIVDRRGFARTPAICARWPAASTAINVKLVKCGGIRGALAMIHTARALGLKIMLGCMVESAILSTAAAHLSPLVDWADLDGPFLVARDPFAGLRYDARQDRSPRRSRARRRRESARRDA